MTSSAHSGAAGRASAEALVGVTEPPWRHDPGRARSPRIEGHLGRLGVRRPYLGPFRTPVPPWDAVDGTLG